MTDTFQGDNSKLIECIDALLALDAAGNLAPHGIGGHARDLLAAASSRLAALSQPVAEAVDGDWYTSAFGSHCIDFDQDPENQLSLLLKRDGTVSAVATRNGTDTSGGHGLDEVADVIRGWAAPAVAQPDVYEQIVRRVAATPDGCILLAKLVSRELDFIDQCISDAIRRCEADHPRGTGEGA